jgi:hypothetical protein
MLSKIHTPTPRRTPLSTVVGTHLAIWMPTRRCYGCLAIARRHPILFARMYA